MPNCAANKPEYWREAVIATFFAAPEGSPDEGSTAPSEPRRIYRVGDPDLKSLDWAAINEADAELYALRRAEKEADRLAEVKAYMRTTAQT